MGINWRNSTRVFPIALPGGAVIGQDLFEQNETHLGISRPYGRDVVHNAIVFSSPGVRRRAAGVIRRDHGVGEGILDVDGNGICGEIIVAASVLKRVERTEGVSRAIAELVRMQGFYHRVHRGHRENKSGRELDVYQPDGARWSAGIRDAGQPIVLIVITAAIRNEFADYPTGPAPIREKTPYIVSVALYCFRAMAQVVRSDRSTRGTANVREKQSAGRGRDQA